jgi:miniconductance mechanosensitive channel
MIESFQDWLNQNPDPASALKIIGVLLLSIIAYIIAYRGVARTLVGLAGRTDTTFDDIIIKRIKPRRLSLYAPVIVILIFAGVIPDKQVEEIVRNTMLFLILWLSVLTFNSALDAVNDVYESRRDFSGEAIKGYLDLVKLFAFAVGIILSISLITGESPIALLAGLGAITAVLLLIFRDTILALVASVQISANDLVKEGDWLEVPAYNADGTVIDINLHQLKIQNWDMTISMVPTHKLMEVSYRNWRGMSESGGRRIKRAISIDISSLRFCDEAMIEKFRQNDLIRDRLDESLAEPEGDEPGSEETRVANSPRLTNVGIYRDYIDAYLRNHPSIHNEMTALVRQLDPGPTGLPIEVYVFTNTTDWIKYEDIQADIFNHLLAIAPEFGLRIFQEPTGSDFHSLVKSI